jgi:Na+/melibiose symporter-like transporter
MQAQQEGKVQVKWTAVILAAFLPAVIEVIWFVYNTYIPVFLQAGNPNFALDEAAMIVGFGLGPALTGFILTFDNIAGLFISPLVGAWSDSMHTRWGRRMPFILGTAPLAAISIIIIPFIHLAIDPELSGQTNQLIGLLIPFVIVLFLVLVPLAVFRTPADTLLWDVTPSKHRSTATAIGVVAGSVLVIAISLSATALFDMYEPLPFLISGIIVLLVVALVWWRVKEPRQLVEQADKEVYNLKAIFAVLRTQPAENKRSLIFLIVSTRAGVCGAGTGTGVPQLLRGLCAGNDGG